MPVLTRNGNDHGSHPQLMQLSTTDRNTLMEAETGSNRELTAGNQSLALFFTQVGSKIAKQNILMDRFFCSPFKSPHWESQFLSTL